jgi:hypothetical protein
MEDDLKYQYFNLEDDLKWFRQYQILASKALPELGTALPQLLIVLFSNYVSF